MKVVHIQRRPPAGRFSVEGYFSRVRENLKANADVELFVLPCLSRGIWGRCRNMLSAWAHQADINHVTGDVNYVAIVLQPQKTVLTVLDCEVLNRTSGWRRALLKWLWYTLPAGRVAAITVISEETRRQLLREVRYPEEQIHVIPVSVSPLFQPTPRAFNEKCPRILQVGTKANKNIARLALALKGISCQLDIVGPLDAPTRQILEDNSIQFNNYVQLTDDQIVERYCEADIVSFVSTYEGFGMPIVEAQSVERVCVTSNCSSMPEVAGDGACLVDPFDVQSIREGFVKVIGDPVCRETIIARGRENKRRFNPQKIADDFLDVYQTLHQRNK